MEILNYHWDSRIAVGRGRCGHCKSTTWLMTCHVHEDWRLVALVLLWKASPVTSHRLMYMEWFSLSLDGVAVLGPHKAWAPGHRPSGLCLEMALREGCQFGISQFGVAIVHYVRNSKRRHRLKTRPHVIFSDLVKWDASASPNSKIYLPILYELEESSFEENGRNPPNWMG
jgi:hypothetical protein